jgi:hypothetical protein
MSGLAAASEAVRKLSRPESSESSSEDSVDMLRLVAVRTGTFVVQSECPNLVESARFDQPDDGAGVQLVLGVRTAESKRR